MNTQTAELYHTLTLIRASADRALASLAIVEEVSRHGDVIVTPQQVAMHNGHDPNAVRAAIANQHKSELGAAVTDVANLAGRIRDIIAPPKAPKEPEQGRLNGLHIAE